MLSKKQAIKKLIVSSVFSNLLEKYTGYSERKTVHITLYKSRTTKETEHVQQLKDSLVEIKNTAIEQFILEDSWSQDFTIGYLKTEFENLFEIQWRDIVLYPEDFVIF